MLMLRLLAIPWLFYKVLGDLKQAKEHHERALYIKAKTRRPEHGDVATSHKKLSVVQRDVGNYRQAKERRQRALDIELETLGPDGC